MADIRKTLKNLNFFLSENKIKYIIIGRTAAIMYGRL